MSFPRYSKYKDSGVKWLGEVPEHWALRPLKAASKLFGRIGFRGYTTADIVGHGEGAITLSPSNMTESGMLLDDCTFISWPKYHESPEIMIRANDVLMVKTGSTLGKVAYVPDCDREMTVNPQIVVFKNIACNSRYLFYFISTPFIQACVDVKNAGSSIPTITQQSIGDFTLTIPPRAEQAAITKFLDRETAKIDSLVGEQQRLIELLKEKRQTVISHAVTKGLNPHAPQKPSGIEWLGEVPAHWNIRSIAKSSTKITNGYVGPTRHILVETGTPYIQATHIKQGRVNFDGGYFVTSEWSLAHAKSILAEGDVLIVQTGAGTGDVGLVSRTEVGFNCHALIIVACDTAVLGGHSFPPCSSLTMDGKSWNRFRPVACIHTSTVGMSGMSRCPSRRIQSKRQSSPI